MKRLLFIFLIGCVAGAVLLKIKERLAFELPAPVAALPDGAVYEGDLVDGVFEGDGRMLWPNGDRYAGTFKNGRFHGRGRFEFAGGDVYEGEFTDGAMTGSGTMYYADGVRYTGELKFGRADGKGTLVTRDNRYEGEFRSNQYEGTGKLTDRESNVYTGEFRDGRFHGNGVFVSRDGRRYQGEFVDGEFTGAGVFTGKNGTRYEGRFERWVFHGRGKLRTAAGDVYEGEFRHGDYHGEGTLTYAEPHDGVRVVQGTWEDGDLIGTTGDLPPVNKETLAELALYNQNDLLRRFWQGLRDNDPRAIDMYFLGIAGDGSQSVFRREVLYVRDYFDRTFGTAGRSMVLVNDRKTVRDIPLATTASIKKSLGEIAKRMDPENDILFLFMTSHGSQEFEFTLDQAGMDIPELSAATLAGMLAELPVRWKVIVISACYSGGFIPPLRDNHTLIITAASADRTSFGCSDRAEFTYFGEAFFKDALPVSGDFAEAFVKAEEIVREREEEEEEEHSRPQIHKPAAILKHLQRWREDLGADTKLAGRETVQ